MAAVVPLRVASVPEAAPISSEALIAAMSAGDPAALGLLFDRYHRDVYGFLHAGAAVDPADLDDLVQDTFLAAFKASSRFQHRSTVKTWLFGIGLNLARNQARAGRTRRQTAGRIEANADSPVSPELRVEAREQLALLTDAIARLPDDLRAAYVTCVIEGISGDDAARILGVRRGTVWRRVHEARELLRLQIGRPSR
jgi:RNA polymerase sigma factor (sigma-70 family)